MTEKGADDAQEASGACRGTGAMKMWRATDRLARAQQRIFHVHKN
jgi:hypothetical protein